MEQGTPAPEGGKKEEFGLSKGKQKVVETLVRQQQLIWQEAQREITEINESLEELAATLGEKFIVSEEGGTWAFVQKENNGIVLAYTLPPVEAEEEADDDDDDGDSDE